MSIGLASKHNGQPGALPATKGITAADVLAVFPGAKIVELENPGDWQAIQEEGARWTQDAEGVWHKVTKTESRGRCSHCSKPHIPEWRRGGKVIDVTMPDGTVRSLCHYCGRVQGD